MRRSIASLLLVLLAACGEPRSPVDSSAPSPSSPLASPDMPPTILALAADESIVSIDSATGEVRRTVVPASSRARISLSAARGGAHAVYIESTSPDCGTVRRVTLASGEIETLGTGRSVALSPIGTQVAWHETRQCGGSDRLVVKDLSSGRSRTWNDDSDIGWFSGVVDWVDDTSVLVTSCGVDACGAALVSTTSTETSLRRTDGYTAPEIRGECCYGMTDVTLRSPGRVWFTKDTDGDVGPDERYPVLEIDYARGVLVAEHAPDGRPMRLFDFDRSGTHLLLEKDGALHVWTTGMARRIAARYDEAVWLES